MSISTKAMIRFNPEGYPPYSRQVAVRRSTRTAEPITRGKLAKTVAQEIKTALGDRPELVVNGYPFSLDNIFLWRLHRVSKGSWQPDIYVLC
ncbi:hypothetical protein C8Q79DRAFT_932671 [Trametes meyenii]|nr:hypothetical protein C8Q79DRAFT_932671 [Trametes meyenii]